MTDDTPVPASLAHSRLDAPAPEAGAPEGPVADPPPYYQSHVFLCTNVRPDGHPRGCCKVKGSERLRDYMKARAKELGLKGVRINTAGCLDRCELGPTLVIYPEGVWYAPRTAADIDEILEHHVRGGGRVARLMLKPGDDPPKGKG
jgi:(2Fe-2S) ferredoxin